MGKEDGPLSVMFMGHEDRQPNVTFMVWMGGPLSVIRKGYYFFQRSE